MLVLFGEVLDFADEDFKALEHALILVLLTHCKVFGQALVCDR